MKKEILIGCSKPVSGSMLALGHDHHFVFNVCPSVPHHSYSHAFGHFLHCSDAFFIEVDGRVENLGTFFAIVDCNLRYWSIPKPLAIVSPVGEIALLDQGIIANCILRLELNGFHPQFLQNFLTSDEALQWLMSRFSVTCLERGGLNSLPDDDEERALLVGLSERGGFRPART